MQENCEFPEFLLIVKCIESIRWRNNAKMLQLLKISYINGKKMYYQEAQQCEGQTFQNTQSVAYEMRDREFALQRAFENITELQNNLAFMLQYNAQLRRENQSLKGTQQKNNNLQNKALHEKDKQITKLKQDHEELARLLQQLKVTLNHNQTELKDLEDENIRLENLICEQKTTIHELEEELMSSKIIDVSCSSYYDNQGHERQIHELERQVGQLQYELKRKDDILERERARITKLERQNAEFKKWMGGLVGLGKVMDGSQRIIMKQIQNRISNL